MSNDSKANTERRRYNKADDSKEVNFTQRRYYTEADEVNEDDFTQRRHYPEADEVKDDFTQRRHYSEVKDVTSYKNAADAEGEADEEENELAAGNETKIENYGNRLTQRRHFDEANGDEGKDVSTKENADDAEGAVEIKEAARVEREKIEDEITVIAESARVERKEVEDCEGIRTQRKHFPGTTTSNIFRNA